jgi:hypothetical protein
VLVPGARADSGAVVTRLLPDLALRLAAWLRDSNAARVLATLRFGRDLGIRVQRLLRHHPVDAPGAAGRTPERVLRRLDDEDVAALFLLRRAEIAAALSQTQEPNETVSPLSRVQQDPARLDRLEQQLWAARRAATAARSAGRLALGGEQIMKLLGCGPGPQIGAALRYLSECVAEDPACNTEASLRVRLDAWSQPNREPGAK